MFIVKEFKMPLNKTKNSIIHLYIHLHVALEDTCQNVGRGYF